eukprot:12129936-Alexandrium_andersonii.AAC.1
MTASSQATRRGDSTMAASLVCSGGPTRSKLTGACSQPPPNGRRTIGEDAYPTEAEREATPKREATKG